MFSPEQLNQFAKELMSRLGLSDSSNTTKGSGTQGSSSSNRGKLAITPSQALVIAGILGGTLDVTSVVMNKDQTVEVILTGSLKRKTELEKAFDKIGQMPFDEVVKAVMGRF